VTADHESVWWSEPDSVQCWWLEGEASRANPRALSFRRGAEALVLLTALAQIDYAACVDEVREACPEIHCQHYVAPPETCLAIGFAYHIETIEDYAPASERVSSAEPATQQFLDDYVWLQSELSSCERLFQVAPIAI
jgi:hypothetical protein